MTVRIPSQELQRIFEQFWNSSGLFDEHRDLTYGALYARAVGIADWLNSQGVGPGDTVALRLPNGWALAASYLACILGGQCFVPVNPELSEEDQTYILGRVAPRLVIEDETVIRSLEGPSISGPEVTSAADGARAIFFTAGTTGRPKGVCHRVGGLMDSAVAFNAAAGLGAQTRMYHVLPMTYMAGFLNTLLCPLMAGGSVVLGPRFAPANALDFWSFPQSKGCNAIWVTPTIAAVLARMTRDPDVAAAVGQGFTHVFCGTAPLTSHIRKSFLKKFGCPLQESYGMSEVLFVALQSREDALTKINAGSLLAGVELGFRPAVDQEDVQEMVVHAPWALEKYLLEDGEASPLTETGGMASGDVAVLEGGCLRITGRLKDLIIRGGVNVSPVTIEDVLSSDPQVADVAVAGIEDPVWGEAIGAYLVAAEGADRDSLHARLRSLCSEKLAASMRPDRYVWLDRLPRSSVGKVQKFLLKEAQA